MNVFLEAKRSNVFAVEARALQPAVRNAAAVEVLRNEEDQRGDDVQVLICFTGILASERAGE